MDISAYLTTPLQLDKICRSCLTEKTDMKPLYSAYLDNMLNSFILIKAHSDDGLPRQICVQCVLQCIDAYSFKQKCEKSDRILREFIRFQDPVTLIHTKIEVDKSCEVEQYADIADNEAVESESDSCADSGPKFDRVTIGQAGNDRRQDNDEQLQLFVRLEAHRAARPPPPTKEHKCDECGAIFPTKVDLNVHLLTHTKKPLVCTVCNETFAHAYDLKRHANIHFDQKPYHSDQDENSADLMERKTDKLRKNNDKPLLCLVCGKEFKRTGKFVNHMKTHIGHKLFDCRHCNRQYSSACNLKVHIRTHTGERPYACHICQQRFTQNGNLKRHVLKHKGESFACPICGEVITQPGDVDVHMRTHTGVRPYVCRTCGKAYTAAGTLRIHARVHTGEKPYKCETCGRRFATYYNLKLHTRIHAMQCDAINNII